mgnify:FL=1
MKSSRSWLVTLILVIFLGELGIHRFYAGKVVSGLIWMFTGGLCGVGWIIDIILVICNVFHDKEGNRIHI